MSESKCQKAKVTCNAKATQDANVKMQKFGSRGQKCKSLGSKSYVTHWRNVALKFLKYIYANKIVRSLSIKKTIIDLKIWNIIRAISVEHLPTFQRKSPFFSEMAGRIPKLFGMWTPHNNAEVLKKNLFQSDDFSISSIF